eukprot:2197286-Alexandrium_andersonii.AAC.1
MRLLRGSAIRALAEGSAGKLPSWVQQAVSVLHTRTTHTRAECAPARKRVHSDAHAHRHIRAQRAQARGHLAFNQLQPEPQRIKRI